MPGASPFGPVLSWIRPEESRVCFAVCKDDVSHTHAHIRKHTQFFPWSAHARDFGGLLVVRFDILVVLAFERYLHISIHNVRSRTRRGC